MKDFKKNFIPLSKIAKEKKFAQEYLGLLARRGDMGSIRIGKRWYTTEAWFLEFEADSKLKKAEVREGKLKIEQRIETLFSSKEKRSEEGFMKISVPVDPPFPEKVAVSKQEKTKSVAAKEALPAANISPNTLVRSQAVKLSFGGERLVRQTGNSISRESDQKSQNKFSSVDRAGGREMRVEKILPAVDLRNFSQRKFEKKKEERVRLKEEPAIIFKNENKKEGEAISPIRFVIHREARGFSPSFLPESKDIFSPFQKFAFGFSFVLLFFLLFQMSYSHKNDIMRLAGLDHGSVAGANDKKANGLSGVRQTADVFLQSQDSQVRESVSFSQIALQSILEKEAERQPSKQ